LAAVASVQESVKNWVKTNHTNLVGTITLLDIAKTINEHRHFGFVYASSAAVYGDNSNPPFKETDYLNPISPYGVDKGSCEFQAKMAGKIFKLPNVGLRFFNVYGERQSPKSAYSGVISIFLNQIKRGKDITIYGDGEQVRDFIYVQDIVTYLCQAMECVSPDGLVFNACTGKGNSINQLANTLINISGVRLNIIHAEAKPGDARISIGDNSLAKEKLNTVAKTSLVEGLTNLCESLGLYIKLKQAS
jgi:UDP-glucose 4-epimerase